MFVGGWVGGDIGFLTKTPCYYLGPIVPQKGQSIKIVCLKVSIRKWYFGAKTQLVKVQRQPNLEKKKTHIICIYI